MSLKIRLYKILLFFSYERDRRILENNRYEIIFVNILFCWNFSSLPRNRAACTNIYLLNRIMFVARLFDRNRHFVGSHKNCKANRYSILLNYVNFEVVAI